MASVTGPSNPWQPPTDVSAHVPDISSAKVAERSRQAGIKAIHFAEQWLSEYSKHPLIQSLEIGQGIALSRREIQKLASDHLLSSALDILYGKEGFTRSVVIVKVGEQPPLRPEEQPVPIYEFFAKRHEHALSGERGDRGRPLSEMETEGRRLEEAAVTLESDAFEDASSAELLSKSSALRKGSAEFRKIFNDEGGINEIASLDGRGEVHALNRQVLQQTSETERALLKQQKTEDALKNAPHVFNRKCMGRNLKQADFPVNFPVNFPANFPANFPLGARRLPGAVYAKMASDGKKFFNYDRKEFRLRGGPAPVDKALKVINQVAQGMSSMHEAKIAWRDMKIDNILFDQHGNAFIADFDTCVHLNDPTNTVSSSTELVENQAVEKITTHNELTQLDVAGTMLYRAPWVVALSKSDETVTVASIQADKAKKDLAAALKKDPGDIVALQAIVEPFYTKADCYDLALFTYLLMTGEYPSFFQKNNSLPLFALVTAIPKNNRDNDYVAFTAPEDQPRPAPLPHDIKWIPKNVDPKTPLSQNGRMIIEGLNKAIAEKNYPKKLADLVWRGLSSNPAEVPTAQEFREATKALLQ